MSKNSKHRIFMVDVFAEQRYVGNPLAVVICESDLAAENMQNLAAEINYSETTFVTPETDEDGAFPIRIFTPSREIEFTGHPILGTAWVIRQHIESNSATSISLNTAIGKVEVTFEPADTSRETVWFCAPKVAMGETVNPDLMAEALGIAADDIDRNYPIKIASAGTSAVIVPLASLSALNRCQFNLQKFRSVLPDSLPPLVYVFCEQTIDPANDISARFFFDAYGIREDPATGNGAAFLGAYLLEYRPDRKALDLRIEQGYSVRRPSLIMLRAKRNEGLCEIHIGGYVIPTLQGVLV